MSIAAKRADIVVGFLMLALAGYLAYVAYGRFLAVRLVASDADPHALRSYWDMASAWLILGWCVLSLPIALAFVRGWRWGLIGAACLNGLYLAPSIVGLAPFAIAMHTVLFAYPTARLFGWLEPRKAVDPQDGAG